jgi:ketosteroid isomerase-like protein
VSEEHKATALRFLAAMDAGDGAAMDLCLTRDAITNTQGFAGVSGQRSREMMVATAAAFKDIVPTGFRPKIKNIIAEGDIVLLEFEGDAVLSSGEPYCNQYAFIFTFEDGKIKQLNEYFCTALADRVMLPLLAQKGADYAQGDIG